MEFDIFDCHHHVGDVAERVVVGTDLSSPPLGRRISHLVPQIIESALTDDEKTQVLGANARKLFGVT